ncbi:gastrula zinc finger protein XlCGF57.1-like [Micropterus dolomieu]|uniref:gastrula zinc finger protein XlCGF57.1-like n=1 Tax=Micropterus dolomieu TaxID=147949 RepID=UPI001E8CDDEC|nr:gastrula zinc finger protein XlCGF57.1-like [Micropterus dolomieu]
MSKVQMLRGFINQRLTAAAEEIFGLFERTISEYEEELCRSKEENQRHRKLLDAVFQPEVRLHRADVQQLLVSKKEVPPEQQQWSPRLDQEDPSEPPHIKEEQEELWTSQEGEQLPKVEEADITKFPNVQQLLVSKEEVLPEQQQWSPRLDQEDPPEPPHIKEEQEELWTSQEGEQLPEVEEADITKFPFTPVPVKSEEDDEENPQSSQLHQSQTEENSDADHLKTETDGKDYRAPEPSRNVNPDSPLQLDTHDHTSLCSEPETDYSWDWEDTRKPQPGLNPLQNNEVPVSDQECNTGETSVSSSEYAARFGHKGHLQNHNGTKTGVKPFSCPVCGKRFAQQGTLRQHSIVHTGDKPFSCSVCGKRFTQQGTLTRHSVVHTGEKPFSCSICGKRFKDKGTLRRHSTVHTGEKPFSCSVCGKRLTQKGHLRRHSIVHTGEKPFSCSVCGKRFKDKGTLIRHSVVHTGEKPFSCSVCGKRFTQKGTLRLHSKVHTGEKPFSCSVCGKRFAQNGNLRLHSKVHTGEKPFSCSVCGKRFALKGNLRLHSIVHTGEKPFSCSVCGKRFALKGNLRLHAILHTGETI